MAAATAVLGACATLQNDAELAMSVVNLLPARASVFETGGALTLRYTNEGPSGVTLRGSSHRLYLNGSYIGRAVSSEPLTIPPLGTATQLVTVYFENLTLLRKILELSQGAAPTLDYRVQSYLYREPESAGRIRLTASGQLDLRSLMQRLSLP